MGYQVELVCMNQFVFDSSWWIKVLFKEKLVLFEKVRLGSINGEMVCKLGFYIVLIFCSEIIVLEVMFEKDLFFCYYLDVFKWG